MTEHLLTDDDADTYLALGVTAEELVRLRWPDATPEWAGWALWNLTPYPLIGGIHDVVDAVGDMPEPTK